MPSGKVHLRIEMVILAGCLALGSYLVKEELIEAVHLTVFFGAYLFSSFFLTPDLDLKQSLAFRRWGIARVLWVPYARLFRHRALSHSILLGPLTRILYLGFILFVITIAAANIAGWTVQLYLPQWGVLISILTGIYMPNHIHVLADVLWSIAHHR